MQKLLWDVLLHVHETKKEKKFTIEETVVSARRVN
jgi:hypothetical protein